MPCVGLSVASDLNLVVWSLFISHSVGGIMRSKLWQSTSFAACFKCFAKSSWEEHVEQLKTVELIDFVAWELI